MNWDVIDRNGKKVGSVELPEAVFNVELNQAVLHQVVKAYRANRRQGTHATKTRSLVAGGGKKPFKQKGTGRARQGSSRSPLMPGGAVVHGPQPRSYREDVNRKVKGLALKMALSEKVRHKKLFVLDSLEQKEFSTKSVVATLAALQVSRTALVADRVNSVPLQRSARNIKGVSAVEAAVFNVEDVLRHDALVLSLEAVKALESRLVRN
jgi:large subunit ribosomal protein L4